MKILFLCCCVNFNLRYGTSHLISNAHVCPLFFTNIDSLILRKTISRKRLCGNLSTVMVSGSTGSASSSKSCYLVFSFSQKCFRIIRTRPSPFRFYRVFRLGFRKLELGWSVAQFAVVSSMSKLDASGCALLADGQLLEN